MSQYHQQHPFVKANAIPGLQDAVGLIVNGRTEVHQDITINEPLWLFGEIVPVNCDVRINGPIIAGSGKIFDLSQGGIISGNPEVERVLVNWWGADRNGQEDSSPAINAAIAFCSGDYKPRVEHVPGRYNCKSQILKAQSFHCPEIHGIGGGSNHQAEPGGVVWDFGQSALGADDTCVKIRGGSGNHCHGGIRDVQIFSNGAATGLQIADQCGAYAQNITVLNSRVGIEFFNETGFTEWNKLVGCQVHNASLHAYRFRRNEGATESFHGAEILDCWSNLAASSPAGVFIDDGCRWYNGTCRMRIFFASGLSAPQYGIASAPSSGKYPAMPMDTDGYLKMESGGGWGVGADWNRVYNFCGPVLALTGVRFGGLNPKFFSMTLGPEAGPANGVGSCGMAQPNSFGPRYITVDANGLWATGLRASSGNFSCEIIVTGSNYEYRISGIAKGQGYGGAGHWQTVDEWALNNARGFGPPVFTVDKNGYLYLTNAKYPPGEVKFYIWYQQTSMSQQVYQRFATMND